MDCLFPKMRYPQETKYNRGNDIYSKPTKFLFDPFYQNLIDLFVRLISPACYMGTKQYIITGCKFFEFNFLLWSKFLELFIFQHIQQGSPQNAFIQSFIYRLEIYHFTPSS